MKKKLTLQYTLSVGLVAILILVVNFLAIILLTYSYQAKRGVNEEVETYVRGFSKHITVSDGQVSISQAGKNSLDQKGLWIQVLDQVNNEVASYRRPKAVKTHHDSIELVNGYKYAGTFDGQSEMLFGPLS
ncbi:hypothetical protein ACVRY7_05000 [Streptococcus ictaluri]|uniref:Uncharacterized protein n=1 Tax=Streptococcus ictaluri 707-05 TaxID=764299 RepID=G5JZE6_9STRE|nr:hypothetical protein [Streptococcus ictaluri]EHI70700.1 hypothetical protein STRIC_0656 [Streptococcus ictaluri 707-05]